MLPHDATDVADKDDTDLLGLLQYVPEPHAVVSAHGRILALNSAARTEFPRPAVLEQALAGVPMGTHHVAIVARGPVRHATVTQTPVRLPDGTAARLVRLHAPPAPAEAPADLLAQQSLLDALPAEAVILDPAGVIQAANVRWRIAARQRGPLLADDGVGSRYLAACRSVIESREGRTAVEVATGLRDVLSRRALAFEHTYPHVDRDGVAHYRLMASALEETPWTLVTHTNVTEAHEAAERQRELTAHFRAVFDHAIDGILIADDQGRCVEANKAASALLGRPEEEVLRLHLREVFPDFDTVWRDLLRRGEQHGSLRIERPGRPHVDIDFSARAGFFPGRHLTVLRDVTAARLVEEQLRHAQKMEAVGQLASGIAHDFNNLLTVVIGNVSHLEDLLAAPSGSDVVLPGLLADAARRDLGKVMWSAERGAELVKKLLAFGRKQRFQPARLSISGFVRDLHQVLRRLVPENIRVEVLAEGDLAVMGDLGALHQVVFNLTTNARDAIGRRDGVVRISVASLAGADVAWLPEAAQSRAYAALSFEDNGCGMDAETLRRIGEPFFTTKGVGEGSGLGMAMVYGLVQQHGGHMHVESRVGEGTSVVVLLPLVDGATDAEPAGAPKSTVAAGGREQVLVVEDEPAVREIAARSLELAGYRVLTAADGASAAAILAEHGDAIDLVVSDLVMPTGGGAAVVEAVARLAPRARLLLTSGYPSRPSQGVSPDLPDAPLLQKPWTPSQLQMTARRILDERRD
ncbi:hypothetical protein TBR22_A48790 [Luteitalea sp. TBR-22]|uniref:ATP-binding response regulator n=1 Tax=Luteitalea sp. TBR-22 TaxID=2802971 RepID=UPI001AF7A2CA|nr:ATP-binding protein [Luteitalea sp. TBR-22]BCS35645.1 hypothetical protein TBR22_A48790 [Luteitalea sp. TBR-22]